MAETKLKGKCRVAITYRLDPDGDEDYWRCTRNPLTCAVSEPVKTLQEASRACRRYIERSGEGASEWTGGPIFCDGKQVARVSYNGKVWSRDGARLAGTQRRRKAVR